MPRSMSTVRLRSAPTPCHAGQGPACRQMPIRLRLMLYARRYLCLASSRCVLRVELSYSMMERLRKRSSPRTPRGHTSNFNGKSTEAESTSAIRSGRKKDLKKSTGYAKSRLVCASRRRRSLKGFSRLKAEAQTPVDCGFDKPVSVRITCVDTEPGLISPGGTTFVGEKTARTGSQGEDEALGRYMSNGEAID